MYPMKQDMAELYNEYMESLKVLVREKRELTESRIYRMGVTAHIRKKRGFSDSIKRAVDKLSGRGYGAITYKNLPTAKNDRSDTNYFSDDRVAVYTCIIGKYDALMEPVVHPDNVDYYAITDFDIPEGSAFKRIDADSFEEIKGMTPSEKNRFFKMNPHKVFGEHKYSIYVDGNIRVCTDFTEHINRMSKHGFSHFRHSHRTCAYEEARFCKSLKKDTDESIDAYVKKLRDDGFPENYGLITCDILVREHNNPECIKIMEQWWEQFRCFVKRDQIAMPYVLYKNGIPIDEVALLGGDVHQENSFEIVRHH